MQKDRVIVICPGRGSYASDELSYLKNYHPDKSDYITMLDAEREKLGQKTVSELDNAVKFRPSIHTKGENASVLIHACAYSDFLSIDKDKYEISAITGNSMGWYIALACAGALNEKNAFRLINTMGSMMIDGNIGGQVLYPVMDDQWRYDSAKSKELDDFIKDLNKEEGIEVYDSIYLGGNRVIGANAAGTKALLSKLLKVKMGRIEYPFQLINHAAFHTPLMHETSKKAFNELPQSIFNAFAYPLVDGRGKIWQNYSTDLKGLRAYTLGKQVFDPYSFEASVKVAVKEFAPDKIILLGPGGSLGSSVAQILIDISWKGIKSKEDFLQLQKSDPVLISMGRKEQRNLLSK